MLFIKYLPEEIKKEIYLYIFKSCDICMQKCTYWSLSNMKDIYQVQLTNNHFEFKYLFLNMDKKICYYCYSMLKYLSK